MLSARKTQRTQGQSSRRGTASERPPASHSLSGGRHHRVASITSISSESAAITSPRAAPGALRTANDVFEVVADGNAEMLTQMIEFSGAKHLCELRSKRKEDYGRNLLHCAVINGQLRTLQVLLDQNVFDPNQVDSVYTRSTPMMEAVKIGQLDLVGSLITAGGRLDIQDVNGDTVLHWAAREVSAAFLRQVLQLARRHGATTPDLMAALQINNNNGETAADVGANELARDSIQRIIAGEETPGLAPKKLRSVVSRSSSTAPATVAPPINLRVKTGLQRPRSAAAATPTRQGKMTSASSVAPESVRMPAGVMAGMVVGIACKTPASVAAVAPETVEWEAGEENTGIGTEKQLSLASPVETTLLPMVKGAAGRPASSAAAALGNGSARVRAASVPTRGSSSGGH